MKIIISNCWSFYNKGDAAIVYGTINTIKEKYSTAEISLLAFDYNSFKNKKGLEKIKIHPMPHLIPPLNIISKLLLMLCYGNISFIDHFGILYIGLQIQIIKLFRYINPNLNKVIDEIDKADLVISVGGNYLYSHGGLYDHTIPIIYAKIVKKKKVIFYGHSIGPFKKTFLTKFMINIFNRIDKIYLREDISLSYLKNDLKLSNKNIFLVGDMAFKTIKNEEEAPAFIDTKKIGITVRPWLYDKPLLNKKYLKSVIETIDHLIKKDYSIMLIPFSYAPGKEFDPDVCEYIYSQFSSDSKNKLNIMDIKEKTPLEIIKMLRENNFTILIGTRLHSVILASLADIPSVIISYQHFKAQGISKQLGLEKYVIKIEDVTPEKLINLTDQLINEQKNKRLEIHEQVNKIKNNRIII